MKKQIKKILEFYKNRKKICIVSNVLSTIVLIFIASLLYTSLLTIYSGGTRLLNVVNISKEWTTTQIDDYIENIKDKNGLEYAEYVKGYTIMKDIKDSKSTDADLSVFLQTKNEKYNKLANIANVFQYIFLLGVVPILTIAIYEVYSGIRLVLYYAKRKIKKKSKLLN